MTGLIIAIKDNGCLALISIAAPIYVSDIRMCRKVPLQHTLRPELQIIFTVVSVFTKENFNPFSNLLSLFSIGTHEIQWLFSIFLTHNWSAIYLLL